MSKYIDADALKAKLDEHYRKYQSKYMETRTPYTQGLIDALDLAEQVIDSLPNEQSGIYDTQSTTPQPFVGIGDVAKVQFGAHAKIIDGKRKAVFDWEQFKEVASIFYGFGKKDSPEIKEKEQPVEGLEGEMDKYYDSPEWEGETVSWMTFTRIARHFAEWQKAKDQKTIELAEDHAMLAGMNKMEQQMMEKAVEGRVGQAGFHNSIYIKEPEWCDTLDKFNQGDRVRVLIVKEDEK